MRNYTFLAKWIVIIIISLRVISLGVNDFTQLPDVVLYKIISQLEVMD